MEVNGICFDSRKVTPGSLFVAITGTMADGHQFIDKAVAAGARAVICEKLPVTLADQVTYVVVKDSSEALAYAAANFYDNPSEKLNLIGVTGTNGKTSIVSMLYDLHTALGFSCGMLTTVVNKIGNREIPATHTTPDAVAINRMLSEMVEAGCDYCFMEVSSHALSQNRVAGLHYRQAVFTNLTHDHLDYHLTFKNYLHAKKRLFDMLDENAVAIVNKDSKYWPELVANSRARVRFYSLTSAADFKGKIIENSINGLHMMIGNHEFWSKLVGRFNAYNLLAVYGVAVSNGLDEVAVLTELSRTGSAPGRFQQVGSETGITAIVDYAHTPDALQNVLDTINRVKPGNVSVISVVGCGGDRDKEKRPAMAKIAAGMSDRLIITADNPRSEEPAAIANDMMKGLDPVLKRKTLTILDRKEAIKTAVALAAPGDIVLVAGKGHEKYQEINGVKHPFDDVAVLEEMLNQTQD